MDVISGKAAEMASKREEFDNLVWHLIDHVLPMLEIDTDVGPDRAKIASIISDLKVGLETICSDGITFHLGMCPDHEIDEACLRFRMQLMDDIHESWFDLKTRASEEPPVTYYLSVDAAVRMLRRRLQKGRNWELARSVTFHQWQDGDFMPREAGLTRYMDDVDNNMDYIDYDYNNWVSELINKQRS